MVRYWWHSRVLRHSIESMAVEGLYLQSRLHVCRCGKAWFSHER